MLEQKHRAMLAEAQRRGRADAGSIQLCFQVLALAGAIDRSCAARLAPHHLSEGKFTLLFLLHDQPDGLSPFELAERAGVTRATITGLVDGLERDGYVARHPHAEDRRKLSVRLTARGQDKARDLFDEHTRWIASLFAGFTETDRQDLDGLLRRIWRNLDADSQSQSPMTAGSAS